MSKEAISVTLATENLLWLRGQAHASGARSVSAVIDRVITTARTNGHVHDGSVRSVVGTVRIAEFDPDLRGAEAAIRALFPGPLVSEPSAKYRRADKRGGRAKSRGPRR
jgi:hypothetical protein